MHYQGCRGNSLFSCGRKVVYAPPLALSTHSGQLGIQRVESYHLEALDCANALEFSKEVGYFYTSRK